MDFDDLDQADGGEVKKELSREEQRKLKDKQREEKRMAEEARKAEEKKKQEEEARKKKAEEEKLRLQEERRRPVEVLVKSALGDNGEVRVMVPGDSKASHVVAAVAAKLGQGAEAAEMAKLVEKPDGGDELEVIGDDVELGSRRSVLLLGMDLPEPPPPPKVEVPVVKAAAPAQPQRPPQIAQGAYVECHSLVGAAELNGRRGFVQKFDTVSKRWHVEIEGVGPKQLKAENLKVADPAEAPQGGYPSTGGSSAPAMPKAHPGGQVSVKPGTLSPDEEKLDGFTGSAQEVLGAVGEPYRVLGLRAGASSSAIRKSYHKLAVTHHPDKGGNEEVFLAIKSAYQALTNAREEFGGGWRDIESQAVGPFQAHNTDQSSATCNCILFDCFGTPPWESRRLYTGSWGEAKVRCWELSKGEPGTLPPPRLVGEIFVGGYINDLAAISPHGLVTAQSAGMIPQPGESLRVFDIGRTPFRKPKADMSKNALEDGLDPEAGKAKAKQSGKKPKPGEDGSIVLVDEAERENLQIFKHENERVEMEEQSTKVVLHTRGCHACDLWPRPDGNGAAPHMLASVSKDMLGISKVGSDGRSLEVVCKYKDPHTANHDTNSVRWQNPTSVLTGAKDSQIKLWDIAGSEITIVSEFPARGNVQGIEVWPEQGVCVGAHSSGATWIDMKSGKVVRQQTTQRPAKCCGALRAGHPIFFMGIGNDLNQYDTRMFKDGKDAKSKVVGQWTLRAAVMCVTCTTSARGNLLVAVGCEDGKVAAFDAT